MCIRDRVPYVCVLIGIIGNLASDAASVMVPPLAAMEMCIRDRVIVIRLRCFMPTYLS